MNIQGLEVSRHAQERFWKDHPDSDEIKTYIRYGEPVSGDVVATILSRRGKPQSDIYVLSPDRRGLFVIAQRPFGGSRVLVTYLRLGIAQQQWANREWSMTYE